MEEVSAVLSQTDLTRLASPFAHLMNQMQTFDGESIHNVVSAGLFALGCAIAQMGSHVDVEASVKEALSPLAIGYTEAKDNIKKRLM